MVRCLLVVSTGLKFKSLTTNRSNMCVVVRGPQEQPDRSLPMVPWHVSCNQPTHSRPLLWNIGGSREIVLEHKCGHHVVRMGRGLSFNVGMNYSEVWNLSTSATSLIQLSGSSLKPSKKRSGENSEGQHPRHLKFELLES